MAKHKIQSTNAADSVETSNGKHEGYTDNENATEDEEIFDNFDSLPKVPRSKRLVVDLDPVPKFLKNLVDGWAPEGMIVSFKLETDPNILVHKALYSLERYQHHLVIGNLLATRKLEVVFVSRDESGPKETWIRVSGHRRKKTISGIEHLVGAADKEKPSDPDEPLAEGPEMEIESLIIPAVEEMHTKHISDYQVKRGC
jgi:phosphopantothenate---cysteine ligase (ATP)